MNNQSRMKHTDHIAISIGKKPFGKYKVISDYAFNTDLTTQVLFDGQDYIWIPTWKEVGAIVNALFVTENLNRVARNKRELSFYEHLQKMGLDNIDDIKEVK